MNTSNICPYCGKTAFSFKRKIGIVPFSHAICLVCDKKVSIASWILILLNLAYIVPLFLGILFPIGIQYTIGILIVGVVASLIALHKYVPLQRDDN